MSVEELACYTIDTSVGVSQVASIAAISTAVAIIFFITCQAKSTYRIVVGAQRAFQRTAFFIQAENPHQLVPRLAFGAIGGSRAIHTLDRQIWEITFRAMDDGGTFLLQVVTLGTIRAIVGT